MRFSRKSMFCSIKIIKTEISKFCNKMCDFFQVEVRTTEYFIFILNTYTTPCTLDDISYYRKHAHAQSGLASLDCFSHLTIC